MIGREFALAANAIESADGFRARDDRERLWRCARRCLHGFFVSENYIEGYLLKWFFAEVCG